MDNRVYIISVVSLTVATLLIIQSMGCVVITPAATDKSGTPQQTVTVKDLPADSNINLRNQPTERVQVSVSPKDAISSSALGSNMLRQTPKPTISDLGLPKVEHFIASNAEIPTEKPKATLVWMVSNAARVTIDNGIGEVPAYGTKEVQITESTTYTLTARNSNGSTTSAVIVVLNADINRLPEIKIFIVSPTTFNHCSGRDKITLYFAWDVTSPSGSADLSFWQRHINKYLSNYVYLSKMQGPHTTLLSGSDVYENYMWVPKWTKEQWFSNGWEGAHEFELEAQNAAGSVTKKATINLYWD